MIRALTARRIAAAAALGGGGITVLGGFTFGLLVAEAKLARKIIRATPNTEPPHTDGLYGAAHPGSPISFTMLGDSTAAGLGVDLPSGTCAVRLAEGLAEIADRPVRLTNVAVSGSRTQDLDEQVTRALAVRPEIAVIMVGANDVTNRVSAADSVRHLDGVVRRLRVSGCQVVVATCPDLGTIKPVKQPLRWIAQRASRQLAAAQTVVVVEQGGRTVSIGSLLGDRFAAEPHVMFSADRYHPSSEGYAAAAAAMLPSVAAALGLEPPLEPGSGAGVLPIYLAAAEAAEEPGTEVAGTQVAGRERGPRGRWATLLRRPPTPEGAADAEPEGSITSEVAPGMA
jgi:lysophospholipase L1-like esterase